MILGFTRSRSWLQPALVLVLAFCVFSRVQADAPPDQPVAYLMEHVWSSSQPGLEARGLFLFQSSSEGLFSRYLIETPADQRVVLTNDLAVKYARDRVTIRDDSTGWWFEVVQRYDVQAAGLNEFLQETLDWHVPTEGRVVIMIARSRGGIEFERKVPIERPPTAMYRTFVQELRSAGVEEQLRKEIPAAFTEAIAFLDAGFRSHGKRSVVEILAMVAEDAVQQWGYRNVGWEEAEGAGHRGVEVTAPELLDFTSRFGSIAPRNPLGDDPLGVLRQEPPPPINQH